MTTALLTHPDCTRHEMPRHPERPERLLAVMDMLKASGVADEMLAVDAEEIDHGPLGKVHPQSFIEAIEQTESATDVTRVDPDTYMSPGSTRAARLAAGAVYQATNLVLDGTVNRAFCAIRPPGHHAELATAMGFCLFNNVAVGALTALARDDIERVAILDFDVHHGNGTVDIFKDDERVLVASSFQEHFYPHRYLDYSNPHVIATPLAEGAGSVEFRKRIEADWLPALERHKPDIIFVSAGFDAHRDDPLGGLVLVEDDFRWVTQLITDAANRFAKGRIVSTLEGGYDLNALASSARVHVETLLQGR